MHMNIAHVFAQLLKSGNKQQTKLGVSKTFNFKSVYCETLSEKQV